MRSSEPFLEHSGLPNPAYFPFETITGEALSPEALLPSSSTSSISWLWSLFSKSDAKTTVPISIPKYPAKPSDVNLAAALQYQPATGLPALQTIIHEFSSKVYQPAYRNFATLVNIGNTDGLVKFSAMCPQSPRVYIPRWSKAITTFCNPGEGVLVGEWTYPSAMTAMRPVGVRPVAVALDSEGIRSDDLRKVLSEWNNVVRGMPR